MSFDWVQYLDLASELSDQARNLEHRDADLRSSISRAYYATYHKSRQYVTNKWHTSLYTDGRAHHQVAREFGYKNQGSIKSDLDRMRAYRHRADYNDEFGLDLEEAAEESIKMARRVINHLSSS